MTGPVQKDDSFSANVVFAKALHNLVTYGFGCFAFFLVRKSST